MSDKLSYLQWSAIDKINHIVQCKGATQEQIHEALQLVRQHLEARVAQTAPTYVPGTELPYTPAVPPLPLITGEQCMICGEYHGSGMQCPLMTVTS